MKRIFLIFTLALALLPGDLLAQNSGEVEERDPVVKEGPADSRPATGEVVLWRISGEETDAMRAALRDAVAGEASRHLFETDQIVDRLEAMGRSGAVTACFKGVEPCISPASVALEAIGASTLIRVVNRDDGATYELVDRRGQIIRTDEVKEASVKQRAFALVRAIFDATANVAFETTPPGATVVVGESTVGTTPLSHRVPVGTYTYILRMPDRGDVRGEVTVGSGETPVVRHDLDLLPGMLVVSDAPATAEVYLNDERAGTAAEPIEIPPGTYSLEVRADGYEPVRDAVTVTPGGTVTRSTPMRETALFDLELTEEQILVNNYILRAGYEFDVQSTTLLDARTDDDLPLEFAGFTENGVLPSDAILRKSLTSNNVRLDASYAFRNFGIVLASVSYGVGSADLEGILQARDGTTVEATITGYRRLHLRPFQLFWRAIYGNWVPSVEVGTGIVFNWYEAQRVDTSEIETLRRTDAMWTFGIAAQYYLTPNVFGLARYSLQGYFEDAVGADHMVSLGVGIAFPNLLGFEPEPPATLEAE